MKLCIGKSISNYDGLLWLEMKGLSLKFCDFVFNCLKNMCYLSKRLSHLPCVVLVPTIIDE